MLGNLLDNACKWARHRVSVTATQTGKRMLLVIEDDGPGVAPDARDRVLGRGVRADEQVPGSGLGLSIVADLAERYGGELQLGDASLGDLGEAGVAGGLSRARDDAGRLPRTASSAAALR